MFMALVATFTACGGDEPTPTPDPVPDPDPTPTVKEKPRYMWIDASANFPIFADSKDNIRRDLQRAYDAGITDVVVDVRPTEGDVLFKCSVIDQVTQLPSWQGGHYTMYTRTATWDYLQAFIDIGHELGLKVHAGVNMMVGGCKYNNLGQQGAVFRNAEQREWVTVLNTTAGPERPRHQVLQSCQRRCAALPADDAARPGQV